MKYAICVVITFLHRDPSVLLQLQREKKVKKMNLKFISQVAVLVCLLHVASADKFGDDPSILIEDPKNHAIDFRHLICKIS